MNGNEMAAANRSTSGETSAHTASAASIRVLVCRVGMAPEIQSLQADERGSHQAATQALVGRRFTYIELGDGVDLWSNDESLLLGLPLNRVIPTKAPSLAQGFASDQVIRDRNDLARPGEEAAWRIHGDFFLARGNRRGDLADLRDADIARYVERWS